MVLRRIITVILGQQDKPERLKVKVHGRDGFTIGKQEVDLRYVEQLIDSEQTRSFRSVAEICSGKTD